MQNAKMRRSWWLQFPQNHVTLGSMNTDDVDRHEHAPRRRIWIGMKQNQPADISDCKQNFMK